MRFAPARALTLVLALLVALPAAANALREPDTALAAAPANRPPDAAALDALDDLRIRNPAAFVAAVTALANGPPPSHRSERERLTLLQAHAEHLQGRTAAAIARAEKLHHSVVNELMRLTLLAPDIIEQFLVGKQPRRLTLMWFQRNRLMVDWHAQRQLMASFEEDV